MSMSRRLKASLFGMIISLNISLRYPTFPHQTGRDGFFHHYLTMEMVENGRATWWLHPLSAFGLYPASYASGMETVLAGLTLLSGMNMEETVLFFSFALGILMYLFSYMLGWELFRDDYRAILFGLIFSTAMMMLYVSTWTITARGTFTAILPLFLWSLLRYRNSQSFKDKMRFFLFTTFFFVFVVSIHHLYTFILPLLLGFYTSNRLYGMKSDFFIRSKWFFPALFSIFMMGWLFFILVDINPIIAALFKGGFVRDIGQRIMYSTLLYGRNLGILTIVGLPAIFNSFTSEHKTQNILLLLFGLIFVTPFFLIADYLIYYLFPFICWFCVLSFDLLLKKLRQNTLSKSVAILLSLSIIVGSSGYFNVTSFNIVGEYSDRDHFPNEEYVEEVTFDTAMWAREQINGNMVSSHGNAFFMKVSAYSGNYHFNIWEAMAATRNFTEFDNMEVELVSPLSIYFWMEYHFTTDDTKPILRYARSMNRYNVTEPRFELIQFRYSFRYVIEDKQMNERLPAGEREFTESVHFSCYKLLQNERGSIWLLKNI